MSPAVRGRVLDVLGRQQAALDCAIERGDVAYQVAVVQRMEVLERALENDRERQGRDDEPRR